MSVTNMVNKQLTLCIICVCVDIHSQLVPAREVELRNRRLHRAIDLDLKHVELPDELQKAQAPWKSYLTPYILMVRARQEERVAASLPTTKAHY